MDGRPIGVFDSGLGGLTAVRRLREILPGEDVVYLGDTGRVPYGARSRETIIRYALEDTDFLLRQGVKLVVVACGTATSNAIDQVTARCPVPVVGIVEAAACRAARETRSGRVGVIATAATIRSGAFGHAVRARMPGAEVVEQACPLLVPLVEDGRIRPGEPLMELAVAEYLEPMRRAEVDTLILGCTHYPILRESMARYLGGGVTLVDSAGEASLQAAETLRQRGLLSGRTDGGVLTCYVTDSTQGFARLASIFLGSAVQDRVFRTDLTTE